MKIDFDKSGNPQFAIGKKVMMLSKEADMSAPSTPIQVNDVGQVGKYKFLNWFTDNRFPIECNEQIDQNAILTRSLNMYIDIAAGNGLVPVRVKGYGGNGKEELEYVNDINLISLLNSNWVYNYIYEALRDRQKFGTGFVQFRPNLAGDKIVKLTVANAIFTRLSEPENGMCKSAIYSGKFPDADEMSTSIYDLLDVYDPEEHLAFLNTNGKFNKSIFHQIRNRFSNNAFYPLPNWKAAQTWVDISNKIPKFISCGLDNILNVTIFIKIPYAYWEKKYPVSEWDGKMIERTAKIQADVDEIEKTLTSVENARKTLITFFGMDESDPNADKWEIQVIQPSSDPENIKNATAADSYIAIASGLNPDVLGLMYGNSKGGSMQRELLLLHEILSTPARREVLTPLEMMIRFNFGTKFQDVELRFKQDFLTTLDTGKQTGTTLN